MSWPSIRDFDGKPILGFTFEHKMPALQNRKEWAAQAYARALEFVASHPAGFIAEDFTLWYEAQGFEMPHSEGCWGAMWRKLVKKNVICKTEERRRTQSKPTTVKRRRNKQQAIVWRAKNV